MNLKLVALIVCLFTAQFVEAQSQRRGRPNYDPRGGAPQWERHPDLPEDVFTFVRIRYNSHMGGKWRADYPDADLNFSYRLQELTSLQVDPDGLVIDLYDERLFDFPFIYMAETGTSYFSETEIENLRTYLNRGGFLMVDDFWGGAEYDNMAENLKKVFPDKEPVELSIEHPIFHFVFDLKEKPQIPAIEWALRGQSWEPRGGYDDGSEPHYRAIFDDDGRMMVIICHNTDLGDGWEREGENHQFFKEYSEPKAYPMGINIVMYALTH